MKQHAMRRAVQGAAFVLLTLLATGLLVAAGLSEEGEGGAAARPATTAAG